MPATSPLLFGCQSVALILLFTSGFNDKNKVLNNEVDEGFELNPNVGYGLLLRFGECLFCATYTLLAAAPKIVTSLSFRMNWYGNNPRKV